MEKLWHSLGLVGAVCRVDYHLHQQMARLFRERTVLAHPREKLKLVKASTQDEEAQIAEKTGSDSETGGVLEQTQSVVRQRTLMQNTSIFTWKHLNYTVSTPDGERKLLDDVQGWVKPGMLGALMGASGAGKTTLLDVLAQRKLKV